MIADLSRRDPVGYHGWHASQIHRPRCVGLLAFIAYATILPIQNRPTLLTSTSFDGAGVCLIALDEI
jgi:hypothetical protein